MRNMRKFKELEIVEVMVPIGTASYTYRTGIVEKYLYTFNGVEYYSILDDLYDEIWNYPEHSIIKKQ